MTETKSDFNPEKPISGTWTVKTNRTVPGPFPSPVSVSLARSPECVLSPRTDKGAGEGMLASLVYLPCARQDRHSLPTPSSILGTWLREVPPVSGRAGTGPLHWCKSSCSVSRATGGWGTHSTRAGDPDEGTGGPASTGCCSTHRPLSPSPRPQGGRLGLRSLLPFLPHREFPASPLLKQRLLRRK